MGRRLPPMSPEVANAFKEFPRPVRSRLLEVRSLIFDTAAQTEGVGSLTETLKWGEPAYLTVATGSGSTIRLGRVKSTERHCAVLFNCRTSLVDTFRSRFPEALTFEKNRAILLNTSGRWPEASLAICLSMALTYHRRILDSRPIGRAMLR
jgi:hypothetical protein